VNAFRFLFGTSRRGRERRRERRRRRPKQHNTTQHNNNGDDDDDDDDDDAEEEEVKVIEMCERLYEAAAKCEKTNGFDGGGYKYAKYHNDGYANQLAQESRKL